MGDTRERHEDKDPNLQALDTTPTETTDDDDDDRSSGGSRNPQAEAFAGEPSTDSEPLELTPFPEIDVVDLNLNIEEKELKPPEIVAICLAHQQGTVNWGTLSTKVAEHQQRVGEAPDGYITLTPFPHEVCLDNLEGYIEALDVQINAMTDTLTRIDQWQLEFDQIEVELKAAIQSNEDKAKDASPEATAQLEGEHKHLVQRFNELTDKRAALQKDEDHFDKMLNETIQHKIDMQSDLNKLQAPLTNRVDLTHEGPTIDVRNINAVPYTARMKEEVKRLASQRPKPGQLTWADKQMKSFWKTLDEQTADKVQGFAQTMADIFTSINVDEYIEAESEKLRAWRKRLSNIKDLDSLNDELKKFGQEFAESKLQQAELLAKEFMDTIDGLEKALEQSIDQLLEGDVGGALAILSVEAAQQLLLKRASGGLKIAKSYFKTKTAPAPKPKVKPQKRSDKKKATGDDKKQEDEKDSKAQDNSSEPNFSTALKGKWTQLDSKLGKKVVDRKKLDTLLKQDNQKFEGVSFSIEIEGGQDKENGNNFWHLVAKPDDTSKKQTNKRQLGGKKRKASKQQSSSREVAGSDKGWVALSLDGASFSFTTAQNQRRTNMNALKDVGDMLKKDLEELPSDKQNDQGVTDFLKTQDLAKRLSGHTILSGIDIALGKIETTSDEQVKVQLQLAPNAAIFDFIYQLMFGQDYTLNRPTRLGVGPGNTFPLIGTKKFRQDTTIALNRISATRRGPTEESVDIILGAPLVSIKQKRGDRGSAAWIYPGTAIIYINRLYEKTSGPRDYAESIGHELTHIRNSIPTLSNNVPYPTRTTGKPAGGRNIQIQHAVPVLRARYIDEFQAHKRQIEHCYLSQNPIVGPPPPPIPASYRSISNTLELYGAFMHESRGKDTMFSDYIAQSYIDAWQAQHDVLRGFPRGTLVQELQNLYFPSGHSEFTIVVR